MNFYKILTALLLITISFHSVSKEKKKNKGNKSNKIKTPSRFSFENKKINLEYQLKTIKNSDQGKKYGQDWSEDQIHLLFGTFGFDLKYLKSHLRFNSFLRYAQAEIFENKEGEEDKIALFYSLHPQNIVPRELVKINYEKEDGKSKQEIHINQLSYHWGDGDLKFSAGRMTVVYGEGLTINPINPFNYNSALSNTQGINQGNDGFSFSLQKDPKVKLNFFFFADKAFTDYDDQITRTIFMRGDWDYTEDTKITYILGEDQKRHKYGFEARKSLEKATGFIQVVKFSKRLDNLSATSSGVFHYLLGYEHEINDKWKARGELGKFSMDTAVPINDPASYLPFESIFALYNTYQFSDKLSSELGLVYDRASGASYYKVSGVYNLHKNYSARLFASSLMGQAKDSGKYLPQKFIPSEIGFALRASF